MTDAEVDAIIKRRQLEHYRRRIMGWRNRMKYEAQYLARLREAERLAR